MRRILVYQLDLLQHSERNDPMWTPYRRELHSGYRRIQTPWDVVNPQYQSMFSPLSMKVFISS